MRKGKSQQAEISVGNLEVISEESFLKRLKGISSCQDCKQKRIKCSTNSSPIKRTTKNKRKYIHPPKTRSNLPIVIKLSDSLRQSRGQKHQRPVAGESCNTEGHYPPSDARHFKHKTTRRDYRDNNFNAMISFIEKAHFKPAVDLNLNLNHCYPNPTLPNNFCCDDCPIGNYRPFDNSNLDIICNDLTGKVLIDEESASLSSSSESPDEEYPLVDADLTNEEIEQLVDYATGCAVTCFNSDMCKCQHCWVGQHSPRRPWKPKDVSISTLDSDVDGPLSSASTTTFSSSEEPSSHDGHDTPSTPSSASDTEDSDTTEPLVGTGNQNRGTHHLYGSTKHQSPVSKTSRCHSNTSTRSRTSKPAFNKVDSSSQIFTITSKPANSESFGDSVYIDLTGTDVEISVFYHNEPAETDRHWCYSTPKSTAKSASSSSSPPRSPAATSSSATSFTHSSSTATSSSFLYQLPSVSNGGFWYYPPVPYFYYPAMASFMPLTTPRCTAPIVSIPRPLCIPRDKDILLSTKTCLIPAHEIDKFTTTQPAQRPWIELAHPSRDKTAAVFTVMCYNVLCDKYCTRQQYGYCPTWALSWEYRKKGIIDEIRHCSADIISLQEVETDQFHNFFLPELKQDGYEGVFAAKSRARTMSDNEKKHVDGCAIFFRSSKFCLVKKHLMEFNQLAMASAEGSHDMLNRVMTKDNIGLAALLETKEGVYENGLMPADSQLRQPILVATAHVHWDPEYSDVKLIQTMMLMSDLKNFIEETQTSLRPGASTRATDVNSLPLILCADLNSLPESGVIDFLTHGKIAANHVDFKAIGYEECMQKMGTMDASSEYLCHDFRIERSYNSDIMPYTNYTYDFKGVIDYIFYSRDFLTTLGILGPIDPEWFATNKVIGCPHPHIPSDHLSLLSQFEMPIPLKKNQSPHAATGSAAFPSSRR